MSFSTTEQFESRPIYVLPLNAIQPDPDQLRKHFDTEALRSLADSLAAEGQIQPILVRPIDGGRFQIISGERRWRASAIAGLPTIKADVVEGSDAGRIKVLQLVENLQREDLALLETISGCAALVQGVGLQAAAARIGKSESWVSQRATLNEAAPKVQVLIEAGKLQDVEVAHIAGQIAAIDADEGQAFIERLENKNGWHGAMTREKARAALKEVKGAVRRKQQMAAEAAKREKLEAEAKTRQAAIKEQAKAAQKAAAKGEKPPAEQLPLVPPPPKDESQWDRQRREQAEAWVTREPEMRKIARDSKKLILTALEETLGKPDRRFVFHVGMLDNFACSAVPNKASAGFLKVEVRGGSTDAGLVLDAVAPDHKIGFHVRATIDQLRQIEAITGEPVFITEYPHVKAIVVSTADIGIRAIHGAQKETASGPPTQPALNSTELVGQYLKERTKRQALARTKASELYNDYAAWCGKKRLTPLSFQSNEFGAAIAAASIEKIRSNGIRYQGVALKTEEPK